MSETQNLTVVQAVRDGLYTEMREDDDVLVLGQDVGKNGGVFRATEGLFDEFGGDRVVDTPLAESGIVGAAVGMAAMGLKPVPEIQFSGFMYPGFDQIVSHGPLPDAKPGAIQPADDPPRPVRWRNSGAGAPPESKEAFYAHEAGLKVVIPSTPYDAKGLLAASIRDPDPVIFLEPKLIYRAFRGEVPEEPYTVPIGEAVTRREGGDVAVFTYGAMTRPTLEAAETLAEEGIDCEVVDLRTVSPLDREAIIEAFEATGVPSSSTKPRRRGSPARSRRSFRRRRSCIRRRP